jgi:hypothetical protein
MYYAGQAFPPTTERREQMKIDNASELECKCFQCGKQRAEMRSKKYYVMAADFRTRFFDPEYLEMLRGEHSHSVAAAAIKGWRNRSSAII